MKKSIKSDMFVIFSQLAFLFATAGALYLNQYNNILFAVASVLFGVNVLTALIKNKMLNI